MNIHEAPVSDTLFSSRHTLKEIISRMLFNTRGTKTMKLDDPDASWHRAQPADGLKPYGLPTVSLLNPLAPGLFLWSGAQMPTAKFP